MLELYHTVNSVCAQKVRLVLAEKGLAAEEHPMKLNGDQYDPAYLELNPNGVVPTLIHDGVPVIESSVILYYLDDAFPAPPLMPIAPHARARVRLYNKLIDEYVHNSCTILSFATAFRSGLLKMDPAAREEFIAKSPSRKRSEFKRDVVAFGLDSHFVLDALEQHQKLLDWMERDLARGAYLAGAGYSIADAAVIPYILRLELLNLAGMWANRPRVADWWARLRQRQSTESAVLKRMGESDWAPFKALAPDPWPKVKTLLAVV